VNDPTYMREEIVNNPVWELAFSISEIQNDNAPIGWSDYIWLSESLLSQFDIKRKNITNS